MAALRSRCGHYIFALYSFYLLSSFSPRLTSAVADWMSTALACTHGVALVRISDAGLKRAARRLLQIQDAKSRQKSPSGHHRTTLLGYIFAIKARINSRKKLLSSNISSRCLRNMVNFGALAAEIDPVVRGTPANFNGFRVLAALLHGTQVLGVSHTLRRSTEGATYIREGGRDVGHWPTFIVQCTFSGTDTRETFSHDVALALIEVLLCRFH